MHFPHSCMCKVSSVNDFFLEGFSLLNHHVNYADGVIFHHMFIYDAYRVHLLIAREFNNKGCVCIYEQSTQLHEFIHAEVQIHEFVQLHKNVNDNRKLRISKALL